MKIVGTIERMKISEEKKFLEIVLQTAEENSNYFLMNYFYGNNFYKIENLKIGDMIITEAYLKGRKWINPESGEISYFMSFNVNKLAVIDMGGNNE